MADPLILALDFGGTKHAAAVCHPGSREWRRHRQAMAPSQSDASSDLKVMMELAEEVLHGSTPACIGVSFGGPVEFAEGLVRLSHHVPGWERMPLRQILERRWNAPAVVDNDANAGAIGEYHFGAGQGGRSMLYLTISTGVGGGWILDGQVWRGADSLAGEVGHMTLDPLGPPCLCGKRGCVERFASGRYIVEDIANSLMDTPETGQTLRRLAGGNIERITAMMVAEAASLGDELSQTRLEQAAWAIGTAIGNCANLVNPERFVLGGGVSQAGKDFLDGINNRARRVALPEVRFEIFQAELGGEAPLWGAAVLAQQFRS